MEAAAANPEPHGPRPRSRLTGNGTTTVPGRSRPAPRRGRSPPARWAAPASRGRSRQSFGPRWGGMHYGTDFAPPCDAPITMGRRLARSSPSRLGYGNWIKIAHADGGSTTYGHMFTTGYRPHRGPGATQQQIGQVGTAGDSTGCHLPLPSPQPRHIHRPAAIPRQPRRPIQEHKHDHHPRPTTPATARLACPGRAAARHPTAAPRVGVAQVRPPRHVVDRQRPRRRRRLASLDTGWLATTTAGGFVIHHTANC